MDDPGGEASWSLDVSPGERQRVTRMDRAQLQSQQLQRLNQLLTTVLPHNSFYARKLAAVRLPITSLQELEAWPVTTKDELVAAEEPLGGAANRTWPLDHYVRFHRT